MSTALLKAFNPSTPTGIEAARRNSEIMSRRLALLLAVSSSALALQVGDPAPDFSATSHTGATVSLKDYAGKKLVLWFYPRASTGG